MRKPQSGFTLIELIVVLIILAVLAAIALPRFANMQAQARIAKMQGALGSMKSAAAMAHGLLLANGYGAAFNADPGDPDINVEGTNVVYTYGYPDVNSIAPLAGLAAPDYVIKVEGGTTVITPDTNHPDCKIVYTPAVAPTTTGAGAPVYYQPTYNISWLIVANCD